MVIGGRTASDPDAPRSVTIPASANGRPVADTVTQFVPVILSAGGKNDSFFTSELALANRGSDAATLNFTYTGRDGVGSGSATDMLVPHQQMIAPDAIDYLSGLGIPMPEIANRVGTLRVGVSGSSEVSVVVRTTTPTAVPEGRAGLAYLGVPQDEGFHQQAVYLCGLRDNPGDRSNVALQNMGSEGSITLRTTVFSGNPADPAGKMLEDMVLGPGEFHQFGEVLKNAGKADPRFGGYVRVERVEGEAPFYAYGVINDNANSDGSFVFPVSAASLEGAMSQTLPALVEAEAFATELTLTNFSGQQKSLMFSVTHERIEAEDDTAGFGPVILPPGQQLIIPQALAHARQSLGLDVPMGLVAPLVASPQAGDLSGVVIGARVVAPANAEDPSQGQYGVFYTAAPRGRGFTSSAWVDGLQQNEENRSNLALINTGEVDGSASVFELDVYDGETGMLVRTVTMAEEPLARVTAKGFARSTASWANTLREPPRATFASARSRAPIPSWPTGWSMTAEPRVREPATAPISRLGSRVRPKPKARPHNGATIPLQPSPGSRSCRQGGRVPHHGETERPPNAEDAGETPALPEGRLLPSFLLRDEGGTAPADAAVPSRFVCLRRPSCVFVDSSLSRLFQLS